jgi:hypothetical protein
MEAAAVGETTTLVVSNNKSNKRTSQDATIASESIDQTSSEPSNKIQKLNEEAVYMKPRSLVDLQLVYCGVVFYVHKAILYKESKFFQDLIDGDAEVDKIELFQSSSIQCACDRVDGFRKFLNCLYMLEPPFHFHYTVNFECTAEPRRCFNTLASLSHYYKVPRIQTALEDQLDEFITNDNTVSWDEALKYLQLANKLNWESVKETCVDKLGSKLLKIRQTCPIKFKRSWSELSANLKEEILWEALDRKDKICDSQ